MAQVHVAHDCQVGSHTIFANAAALAGHVEVQDFATVGAYSAVHQFCRVGTHAFMGGAHDRDQDVLPYSLTVGNRARIYGLNIVGLRRRGFAAEALRALRARLPRCCCRAGCTLARGAATGSRPRGRSRPRCETLVAFVRSSKRGVRARRARRAGRRRTSRSPERRCAASRSG